jgi:hypothetical protein
MDLNLDYLNNIKKSFTTNYKSWLFIALSIVILSRTNLIGGFITFIILIVFAYFIHYYSHLKTSYPFNITHLYHHENNNFFSHFIQITLEFVALLSFLYTKYFAFHTEILNEWVVIFFYFFYTTIHNINYSIFLVNNVHENHHKFRMLNMGPDICDVIFNTKYDLENSIENTDHYIPNIIISLIITLILKNIWNLVEDKEAYQNIFVNVFAGCFLILFFSSLYLWYEGKIKKEVCAMVDTKVDAKVDAKPDQIVETKIDTDDSSSNIV